MLGGAEVSHATSDLYKKKVVEFLELDGFILIGDSSRVAMTPDLIFRKPEVEGKIDIHVETKYDDVSLSDKEFLAKLGRFFISYTSNPEDSFDLYLFFRRCKNFSKWKQIFSAPSFDEDTCFTFFKALSKNEGLNKDERQKIAERHFEDFERFVSDTYVHQINYDVLLMRIDEIKKGRKDRSHGYDYYLRELPPIKEKQKIVGNFVEIKDYSGLLYSYETEDGVENWAIYNSVKRYDPIHLEGGTCYALKSADERLNNYVKEETCRTSTPKEWAGEDPYKLRILQILFKKHILSSGVERGCEYHFDERDKRNILYFAHRDYTKDLTHVEGKQVARLFKDTTAPFVKHEAIEIDVKIYDGRLFVFFSPSVLFSDQNKEIITGKKARRLHHVISSSKFDNNLSIYGDMEWWFNFLCGKGRTCLDTSELFDFVSSVRPPRDSATRDGVATTQRMEKYLDVQTGEH